MVESVPKCPTHLRGVAAREWNRLAPALFSSGRLTPFDESQLEMYCELVANQSQHLALYRRMKAKCKLDGLTPVETIACLKDLDDTISQETQMIREISKDFQCETDTRGRMAVQN